MADQIFLVNSSSFNDVEISASLRAGPGIVVDFTRAAEVTGTFAGSGINLTHLSASYIVPNQNTTASFAITASHALNVVATSESSSWASSSISSSHAETASYASTVDVAAFDRLILPFQYTFSNTTSAGDPGKGKFRYNSTITSSINAIYFDSLTEGGLDISNIINSLKSGSYDLYIQQKDISTRASLFQVISATDNTGWFTVSASHLSSADDGLPQNNKSCAVYVINKTSIVEGQTYPVTASWSVNAASSSYIVPGATLYVISGSGNISSSYIEPYNIPVNPYNPPFKEGRMFYDSDFHNWVYYPDLNFKLHMGKEVIWRIHNPYNTTLVATTAVYISGSTAGGLPDAYKAIADGTDTKSDVVGIVRSDILSGSFGYVLCNGVIHAVDVGSFQVGDQLWLSPTVAGGFVDAAPGQPYESIRIGSCQESGISGSIALNIFTQAPPANAYAGMTSFPTITDDTSSFQVYISSGSVNLYDNVAGVGAIVQYPVPEISFSLVAGVTASFLYAASNGTTASYGITSNYTDINGITKVQVATLYRADVDTHVLELNSEGLALANKLQRRLIETEKFAYESGLTLSTTGSHYLVTAGAVWFGATQLTASNFDSRQTQSLALPIDYDETHFAYHSASQWVIPIVPDGTWNNSYYDNGTNLIALAPLSYSLNYMYRILGGNLIDDDVFYITSNNQYPDAPSALLDTTPLNIPGVLDDVSTLVGRIIFQSGSNTASLVESAFTTNFGQSLVTQHNNLSGINGDSPFYHLSFADYIGTGTGIMVKANGPTITNANITGSLFGTVSTASYVVLAQTASFVTSASYSTTSSFALNSGGTTLVTGSTYPITASWSVNAETSSISTSSSFATTSSTATSITFVPPTASFANSASRASFSISSSYVSMSLSRGGTFFDPLGLAGSSATASNMVIWRANTNCTVTQVWGYRVTGSGALMNARKNGGGTIATGSHINLTTADTWLTASSLLAASSSFVIGDRLEIMLISSSGFPTQLAVQVDFVT